MKSIEELELELSRPSDRLIEEWSGLEGDVMILGAAGKMGPTLARMARRTLDACRSKANVIAVSRYSNPEARDDLEKNNIQTIACDLLDDRQLQALPDARNVFFMAGTKFGTHSNEPFTWIMNSYMPGRVASKFRDSRMVVFSTGNVYPLTGVAGGGPTEDDPVGPVGEYAQSCLGRERVCSYFSIENSIPMLIYRLNYAIDLRYGVLLEIARSVWQDKPIDLTTGYVNVIWQGDANDMALRCLQHCAVPPTILNVTGPEVLSVRAIAQEFGKLFQKTPVFTGSESDTALLSNARKATELFGAPRVSVSRMITWTAEWVRHMGAVIDKPTHFQQRKGVF
jgi:nucleoside-diphosphate-sugar epimerase